MMVTCFIFRYGNIDLARHKSVTVKMRLRPARKLPQPTNKAAFLFLKDNWGNIFFEHFHTTRSNLSKAEFEKILSSVNVWRKSFFRENIQKAF